MYCPASQGRQRSQVAPQCSEADFEDRLGICLVYTRYYGAMRSFCWVSPLHNEISSHLRGGSSGEGSSEVPGKDCLLLRLRAEAGS